MHINLSTVGCDVSTNDSRDAATEGVHIRGGTPTGSGHADDDRRDRSERSASSGAPSVAGSACLMAREGAFTCTATMDSDGWFIQCDQIQGACTKVKVLTQAESRVRRAIASVLDMPEDSLSIDIRPVLPRAVNEHLDRAKDLRRTATRANHDSAAHTRAAARILSRQGLSLRDIGAVLGVSHQRAHQIIHA